MVNSGLGAGEAGELAGSGTSLVMVVSLKGSLKKKISTWYSHEHYLLFRVKAKPVSLLWAFWKTKSNRDMKQISG